MRPTGRCSSARGRRRSTAPTAIHRSSIRSERHNYTRRVNAYPTALARLRGLVLSPAQFLPLALVQIGALWLIVGTGAAVRLTDSGLGCRHWPGCEEGHPLPAKDGHAYIEFGNRLFGGVTIAVALVVWLAARRTPALPRWSVQLTLVVFLGTLLQAPIGLLAVASDLRWPIVMLHLLLSIALLGGATVLVLEVRSTIVGRTAPPSRSSCARSCSASDTSARGVTARRVSSCSPSECSPSCSPRWGSASCSGAPSCRGDWSSHTSSSGRRSGWGRWPWRRFSGDRT